MFAILHVLVTDDSIWVNGYTCKGREAFPSFSLLTLMGFSS